MAISQVRIGGSGYTTFTYNGALLGWMQVISDTAPQPVVAPHAIQPMDAATPVEIVTPGAVGAGVLQLTVYELWNAPAWTQLGFANTGNLLDVFNEQLRRGSVQCVKHVVPPGQTAVRSRRYEGCMITNVDESETVNIGTLEIPKSITMMYTAARWLF